ncbi:MAG TPA: GlxA family transcriptional regulator [Baekduia sp.]|uniref:GlxA family transcriptional regulator n=1 Tax=Baekduia sp. TaxID=2600305 RepID=UPI002C682F33|nr:GlxA family transcriptional regulator [Baekduia sp.]HMJ35736.1 GlxA family transcriptional regulator [Baekduia sp.]
MRTIVLAVDDAQALDVIGPVEVFDAASKIVQAGAGRVRPGYDVQVVSPGGGDLRLSNGLRLSSDPLPPCGAPAAIDTILVAGGAGARELDAGSEAIAWLRDAAPRARRVASVCTGAFALATAGLLEGRRATTHWAHCRALGRDHPGVEVDAEPIYVRDGNVWTSAGVTAGMDLTLALVEEDLGREVALEAARWLVLFLKRPGGQAQFSAGLAAQTAVREPLRDLQDWLGDHLDADLSVGALAARACLSDRQFARAWRAETGMTPAAYVLALRIERARALLEDGQSVDAAARRAGFGSAEVLRRVFHRRLGVGPSAYRERFRAAA